MGGLLQLFARGIDLPKFVFLFLVVVGVLHYACGTYAVGTQKSETKRLNYH